MSELNDDAWGTITREMASQSGLQLVSRRMSCISRLASTVAGALREASRHPAKTNVRAWSVLQFVGTLGASKAPSMALLLTTQPLRIVLAHTVAERAPPVILEILLRLVSPESRRASALHRPHL